MFALIVGGGAIYLQWRASRSEARVRGQEFDYLMKQSREASTPEEAKRLSDEAFKVLFAKQKHQNPFTPY